MAINVSVQQYNGGFLPEMILLIQCYYHRGTTTNPIIWHEERYSEGLGAFIFFSKCLILAFHS